MILAVSSQLEALPGNLAGHLAITVISLLAGLALSVPLALLAICVPRMRYSTLTAVSVVQTIPSLALLALMVLLFSTLGFVPTVVALTLYSILPILRNMVTGILDVDPALTEAARGVGMTRLQSLWHVELPLALPVIVAGIRTAAVWTVGMATLATPVGQRCLGNYIFSGLQTRNWTSVLYGCVSAALLAILLDLFIGSLERAAAQRRRGLALAAGGALVVLLGGGLLAPSLLEWTGFEARNVADTAGGAERAAGPPIVIGSKTFTEQYILADVLSDTLQEAGFRTERRESLGSTVVFDALVAGEIDCYVDYTGTIWSNYMKRRGSAPPSMVLAEASGWLAREHRIRCLGSLGFENAYGLAMRRAHAEELGIRTLDDLAAHADKLKIGADYEFLDRPEWQALRETYGLGFKDQTTYDSTFMYESVASGQVDVISAFTSDGRIGTFDLVILDDPRGAIPPYDAVLLVSESTAERPAVVDALAKLIGRIDVESMRAANDMVDRDEDKRSVAEAAAWLRGKTR